MHPVFPFYWCYFPVNGINSLPCCCNITISLIGWWVAGHPGMKFHILPANWLNQFCGFTRVVGEKGMYIRDSTTGIIVDITQPQSDMLGHLRTTDYHKIRIRHPFMESQCEVKTFPS